jgi:hypothetical protein
MIGALFFKFGTSNEYPVAGGPFRECPEGVVGVNMAAEIHDPALIRVPTEDFSIPNMETLTKGVAEACVLTVLGHPVYVGCMGGIGRTGLFMACMAKVSLYMDQGFLYRAVGKMPRTEDVVGYVRKEYYSHAVETHTQEDYIHQFDPRQVAKIVRDALKIRVLT